MTIVHTAPARPAYRDSPQFRMQMLQRSLTMCMPAKEPRTFADLEPGTTIAISGYVYVFEGVKLLSNRPRDGQVKIEIGVSYPDTPNPTNPRLRPGAKDRAITLRLDVGADLVTDRDLYGTPLRPLWHPLDWCTLNPEWHYPACAVCQRLWPCDHAKDTLQLVHQAESADKARRSCHACRDWIRDGHSFIQFGTGPVPRLDKLNPTAPVTGITGPTLVLDGTTHDDYAGSDDIVRFCHRSKCVTAAYRYGEANGCPIPIRRKDLGNPNTWPRTGTWPVVVDIPERTTPQPPVTQGRPELVVLKGTGS